MTDQWTWTYENADGAPIEPAGVGNTVFPTQSDAETWLGEQWRALAAAGVTGVTLKNEDSVIYGPMSLSDGS